LPYFFLPIAAASALGFLTPCFLSLAVSCLNLFPDPSFGFFFH